MVVYDVDVLRCERFAAEHPGVEVAESAEAVLARQLDVLAPCAAGGLIDDSLARTLDAWQEEGS